MGLKSAFRRRKLLINYRLQLTLILHTLLVALVTALCVQASHLSQSMEEVYVLGLGLVSTRYLPYLPLPLLVALIVWGFLISNRIAGPVFNLQRHLALILDGKTDRHAKSRNADYFKELFDVSNRLSDAYLQKKKESKGL